MKKTMGIITLIIAGLLMLNVGLISAEIHPTATVSGTVIDAETEIFIVGALVELDSDPALSATTDGAGAYSIEFVPLGEQSVTASHNWYESKTMDVEVSEDEDAFVNFSLNPLFTVNGTVTDYSTGEPIGGAKVAVDGSETILPATTGSEGEYVFDDVFVWPQSFTASAVGYGSETMSVEVPENGEAIVNFSLKRLVTVTGKVIEVSPDAPIGGAAVEVDGSSSVLPATTIQDGTYELENVPVGPQSFTASHNWYESKTMSVEVPENGGAIEDFILTPLETVIGKVTDATTGGPIEGALVVVDGSDPFLSTNTNSVGEHEIIGVPGEQQSFTASANGYNSETVGVEVSGSGGATVNFTLQPLNEEKEELKTRDEGVKKVGTRRGYVGIYSPGSDAATATVTSAGTADIFTAATGFGTFYVMTKHDQNIEILIPYAGPASIIEGVEPSIDDGVEPLIKTPGWPGRVLKKGDRIVVLVEFVEIDGELAKVALKIIVKPNKPLRPTVGAVVGITTDDNGVRTVSIMGKNGKVKVLQLGPEAELPEVGDLVTVFQGRGRGGDGNGPAVAKSIVRAEKVRQRLEGFLEDLTSEDGDLPPQALERRAKRVADIAARLENHASKHVELIQQARRNGNLPPRAVAGLQNGLETAESGLVDAKAKGAEAKTKAGPPSERGQSQAGRGKKK